jgi:hypothetical protein
VNRRCLKQSSYLRTAACFEHMAATLEEAMNRLSKRA